MTDVLGSRTTSGPSSPLASVITTGHTTFEAAVEALTTTYSHAYDSSLEVVARAGEAWCPVVAGSRLPADVRGAGPLGDPGEAWAWCGGPDLYLVVPTRDRDRLPDGELAAAAVWLDLHRQRDAARGSELAAHHEAEMVRAVTEQLRSMRDLDEVLHSIARRTLDLLDADICGVLLREDDQLLMRSCVGNRLAETAKLTMRRGQGVAGLVFATGTTARVDDYRGARIISRDFVSLADREETRSAMAVPLTLHDDLIGVLEVWRRRASVFTELDEQRLVTLADFATIAIANARLYDEQATMLHQLDDTRAALEREVSLSRRLAALQQRLTGTVLRRPTLSALAEVVADELDCAVGIYAPEGQPLALVADSNGSCPPEQLTTVAVLLGLGDGLQAHLSPVVVENEPLGSIVLLGPTGNETLAVASTHVALAVSLAHLHERAASRARAEALEQAMWDLLAGPIEARMAARSRAQQIGFNLSGAHVVALGKLKGPADVTSDAASLDAAVTELLRCVRHDHDVPRRSLIGARGNLIAAVLPVDEGMDVRGLLSGWSQHAHDVSDGLSLTWGVSRTKQDAFALAKAFNEAKVALDAAQRMGDHGVGMYDDLGIARILLGSGSDPDVQSFVDEVTAPLLKYDGEHDAALLMTLRAFFDANCSQKLASERLFIHHKTMRYRLDRIEQLTGLNLAHHDDRVRADFALRLLQVHETDSAHDTPPVWP
ncbi:MAG: putative transcriptional regulator, PucR family [Marmoricola sp.]|nr:putative transcriptional regulator, PucR family [Marmoricola sp.]